MSNFAKRLEMLEASSGEGALLLVITADYFVMHDCDEAGLWPDCIIGLEEDQRREKARRWRRNAGESILDFRERVSRDIGMFGPAGTLPPIVDPIYRE